MYGRKSTRVFYGVLAPPLQSNGNFNVESFMGRGCPFRPIHHSDVEKDRFPLGMQSGTTASEYCLAAEMQKTTFTLVVNHGGWRVR